MYVVIVFSLYIMYISAVVMLNKMNDEMVVILTALLMSAAESPVEML